MDGDVRDGDLRDGDLRDGDVRDGDLALARGRACALFAELWDKGLTPETVDAWQAVFGDFERPEDPAVLHQAVAVEGVFPYASVYFHEAGLMGQDEEIAALREDLGLASTSSLSADHLSEELRLLAHLAGIERLAFQGRADLARVRADQRHLLDSQVLRWLPTFEIAIQGLGAEAGIYGASAPLLLELLRDWRGSLGGTPPTWALPELRPGLLEQEGTDLARISRRLCTPALAGGFLSASVIHRLGRALDLPRGFGKRWQQLESLLHAAAHYSALPQVLAALDLELQRWDQGYAHFDGALTPLIAPWRERVAESRALVGRLDAAVRDRPATPDPDPRS